MADSWEPPARGALDDTPWPTQLVAKAIARDPADHRMHGYAVLGDLARNYPFSDLTYLALSGELPTEDQSRAFALALFAFAPTTIAEAPAHVAHLGRIAGGRFDAATGAGFMTAANHAHAIVADQMVLLAWLAAPTGSLPERATDSADAPWLATLLTALAGSVTSVRAGMSRNAARIALLFDAGLRDPERITAAIAFASSLGMLAEALVTGPADLRSYPVKLPPFHYVEHDR
ncbi:MAG: hypothetical protein ABJE66_24500 [Deltaproteobacteria bacterium]